MDLAKLAMPWTAEDGTIACEWEQHGIMGGAVIAERIEQLIGRISMFSVHCANVLRMWDRREKPNVTELLACLQLPRDSYAVSLSTSRTPIESGYLECMHLAPSADGVAAADAIAAFATLQNERYSEMEPFLQQCYGQLSDAQKTDRRFHYCDYPGFDSGSMQLGFGLFAEHTRYRSSSIWCWSRVVCWHK